MKKGFISLWTLFVFLDILMIIAGLAVLAYGSENNFINKLCIPTCILFLCTVISFTYHFVTEYRRPPDFVNDTYNIGVWSNVRATGGPLFKEEFDFFLKFFTGNLPRMILNTFEGRALESTITVDQLNAMLQHHKIEFRKGGILFYATGSNIREKYSAYSRGMIILRWRNTLGESDLYHMLGHLVKIFVLQRLPDIYHIEQNWWGLIELLRNAAIVAWKEENTLKGLREENG